MTIAGKYVIALEEHYYDAELAATFTGAEGRAGETRKRLNDLGELRLAEMDEADVRAVLVLNALDEDHQKRADQE